MKNFKKFLALMLAVVMLICLVACDDKKDKGTKEEDAKTEEKKEEKKDDKKTEEKTKEDEKTEESKKTEEKTEEKADDIVGEWVVSTDITDEMNEGFAELLEEDIEFSAKKLQMYIAFEFEDDDSFLAVVGPDEDELDAYVEAVGEAITEWFCEEYECSASDFEEAFAAEFEMELEEFVLGVVGIVLEDYLFEFEGYYALDEKKGYLYIGEDEDELESEECYFEYTLSGKTLTLGTYAEDGEEVEDVFAFEDLGGSFPYKLKKQ